MTRRKERIRNVKGEALLNANESICRRLRKWLRFEWDGNHVKEVKSKTQVSRSGMLISTQRNYILVITNHSAIASDWCSLFWFKAVNLRTEAMVSVLVFIKKYMKPTIPGHQSMLNPHPQSVGSGVINLRNTLRLFLAVFGVFFEKFFFSFESFYHERYALLSQIKTFDKPTNDTLHYWKINFIGTDHNDYLMTSKFF